MGFGVYTDAELVSAKKGLGDDRMLREPSRSKCWRETIDADYTDFTHGI